MALPCVVVTAPAAAVVEATSVLLVSSAPSSACWAADGYKAIFKIQLHTNKLIFMWHLPKQATSEVV